jgi:hypothetical protein
MITVCVFGFLDLTVFNVQKLKGIHFGKQNYISVFHVLFFILDNSINQWVPNYSWI